MSQPTKTLPSSKEAQLQSYTKRLQDDTKSMIDNFMEILKLAKEEPHLPKAAQTEQDRYEMEVRATNMVRAGESLLRLVSDIREYLILNDFPFVNDSIAYNTQMYKRYQCDVDTKLQVLRDKLTAELFELETEYYSSPYK